MKKLLLLFCLFSISAVSQTYVNILDNTYIRITGGSSFYINSSTPNTIIKTGTSGGFICDSENDKIIWNIGNSTGIYSIPFCSSIGNTIPFTYNITTAGTGTTMLFNSYETADNNIIYPTSVSGVFNNAGTNNSNKVIDRYWIINTNNYTTKPKGTYTFEYDDNDLVGNLITESNLYAQRWNSDLSKWGDWLYSPFSNTATNTVQITIANPLDQYNIWTLSDADSPLPIELLTFDAVCNTPTIELTWTTASETNSNYYVIQKSIDGNTFSNIGEVFGSGNSNSIINYSIIDYSPYFGISYYRLKHIDFDGAFTYSNVISVSCENIRNIFNANVENNNLNVFFNFDGEFDLELFDISSKLLFSQKYYNKNKIEIPINDFAKGIYLITINNQYKTLTKKIIF